MPKEKNCDCCRKPFSRGITLWIKANTFGRWPHAAGKAQRISICEECDQNGNPVLAHKLQQAARAALGSVALSFQDGLCTKLAAAKGGANNASGAAV